MPHYERALAGALDVDFVEVVTENFFGEGGRPRAVLEAVRRERPLVFHGVSLGVGSPGEPDLDYLRRVRALADAFEPAWLSDHVCWTRIDGRQSHELLPLPFTREALERVIDNTQRTQEILGRPLLLENVSSYVAFAANEMPEWAFLAELAERSGCFLLLDLNNVLVNAHNHGFAPLDYLAGLPSSKVRELHLANHSRYPGYRFDDHRGPVPDEVWQLFDAALRRFGPVSSIVEWDEDLPAWDRLAAEAHQARQHERIVLGEPAPVSGAGARAALETGVVPGVRRAPSAAPTLERIQRLTFAALTWPEGVADFASTGGGATRAALLGSYLDHADLGPIERLDIYANAYFYRLLGALREVYPRLARQLGEPAFHNLVTDYLLEHPSTSPDLTHLADALPAFLRSPTRQRAEQWQTALPGLAELELALARALHAPDAETLTHADLLALAPAEWPSLVLRLVPSASTLALEHDVSAVVERPGVGAGGGATLVARRQHSSYYRRLEPLEALALEQLTRATPFGLLCERLSHAGATPEVLVHYLERWVADGLVQRVDNARGVAPTESIR